MPGENFWLHFREEKMVAGVREVYRESHSHWWLAWNSNPGHGTTSQRSPRHILTKIKPIHEG